MANKLLERFKNTKARSLLIFGLVIFLIIAITVYFFTRKSTPLGTEQSKTSGVPQITAIPGGVTSERYQELQEEENRRRAEAAKKKGVSEVATIIGSRGKDSLASKERFGIEDLMKGECKCPPPGATSLAEVGELDPARAAALIAELEANPDRALELLKANPGLGKALCTQKPDLAMKIMEKDSEAAKIILNECPELAKVLAEKNPALFKKLMLENPDLARKLAEKNPELFKKLMLEDPEFAKGLARTNPELLKTLLKNDPDFADKFGKQHPDILKDLMKGDPEFAKTMMKNNPALVKQLMLDDPEFANAMARANPDAVKEMMLTDPEFARKLALANPTLVKELMKNDPNFARALAKQNPDLVKKLMLDDPEFAKIMAKNAPDMVKELMLNDPEFARKLAAANPDLVKELMKNDPNFARALAKQNPELVKKLMLDDPEFARIMARNVPDMVSQLMQDDPAFAAALRAKIPDIDALLQSKASADKIKAIDAQKKQKDARLTQQQLAKLNEQQQKQIASIMGAMEGQAKSIFQAWNEFNAQQFVQGDWAKKQEEELTKLMNASFVAVAPPGGPVAVVGPAGERVVEAGPAVLFKAGTVIFAVLDTTVSSDEPGPILATVVEGRYKGARLVGSFTAAPQPGGLPPEKVILNFTTMNIASRPASISISAVAIDPDTARTALATDVDNHFLLRYGSILASSFLVGYAKVITSAGSVQTSSANGLATTTTAAQLSGRKEILAALGEVGKKLGESWKGYANIPPTITVDAGTGIGILFLADVTG